MSQKESAASSFALSSQPKAVNWLNPNANIGQLNNNVDTFGWLHWRLKRKVWFSMGMCHGLTHCHRDNIGEYTFLEAFDRTIARMIITTSCSNTCSVSHEHCKIDREMDAYDASALISISMLYHVVSCCAGLVGSSTSQWVGCRGTPGSSPLWHALPLLILIDVRSF